MLGGWKPVLILSPLLPVAVVSPQLQLVTHAATFHSSNSLVCNFSNTHRTSFISPGQRCQQQLARAPSGKSGSQLCGTFFEVLHLTNLNLQSWGREVLPELATSMIS